MHRHPIYLATVDDSRISAGKLASGGDVNKVGQEKWHGAIKDGDKEKDGVVWEWGNRVTFTTQRRARGRCGPNVENIFRTTSWNQQSSTMLLIWWKFVHCRMS